MRLSTSPLEIRNKIIPKMHYVPQMVENARSNSLSNSSLHSSKFMSRVQTPYCSPYYNQNPPMYIASQQQLGYEPKMSHKMLGNSQNSHFLQNTIKNLSERLQHMEMQLKKQQTSIKSLQKTNDQKNLLQSLQQKINHEVQRKSVTQYELLFREIKRLQTQISEKVDLETKTEIQSLGTISFIESGRQKTHESDASFYTQRRNVKIMQQKIKEEIFKLQIHLQNQMNKALKTIKASTQLNNDTTSNFPILSKSRLKYKYHPLKITIKNEIKASLEDSAKRSKDRMSTSNSTGSSEQNEGKILDLEEITYFVDKEGYLLDQNGFYLLDDREKMIKVDRSLIRKLREFNMIQ